MNIKVGDKVILLTGKYEERKDQNGKLITHKVIAVSPKEGKVIVEGANVVKKHKKARKQGDVSGIIETEGAIYASKVQLYCAKCKKGVRAKVGYETDKNGKTVKVRLCRECGEKL